MSLEQAVKDNTAAIVALTAALIASKSGNIVPPGSTATEVKAAAQEKANGTPTPASTPTAPTPPAANQAPQLTYEEVAKVVTDFVRANGRAPAVILLKPLNATTIVPFKGKPAELAQIHAIFTDPVKGAAAIAEAAAAPKA